MGGGHLGYYTELEVTVAAEHQQQMYLVQVTFQHCWCLDCTLGGWLRLATAVHAYWWQRHVVTLQQGTTLSMSV